MKTKNETGNIAQSNKINLEVSNSKVILQTLYPDYEVDERGERDVCLRHWTTAMNESIEKISNSYFTDNEWNVLYRTVQNMLLEPNMEFKSADLLREIGRAHV